MSDSTMESERFAGVDQEDRRRRLRRIASIARMMDTAVGIPFTGMRFGMDSVIGLIPGVGDAAGGLVGLYMINEARRLGVPRHKLLAMIGNIGLDTAVGSVPLLGDVFDLYFKSHRRNAKLILDHFQMHPDDLDPRPMKDITPKG